MDLKSRRNFFKASAQIAALAGVSGLAAKVINSGQKPRRSSDARVLRVGIHNGLVHREFFVSHLEKFADQIRERSSGTLILDVSLENLSRPAPYVLHRGDLDLVLTSPALQQNSSPSQLFLGSGPFQLTSDKMVDWLSDSRVQEIWNDVYGFYGLSSIMYGVGASEFGQFSRTELKDKSCFSQLKISSSDWRSNWFTQLGAKSVEVDSLDMLMRAYQNQTLDLTDPLPHSVNRRISHQVDPSFYVLNPYWRTSPAFELMSRRQTWSSFSADEQTLLRTVAAEKGRDIFDFFQAKERGALAHLKSLPTLVVSELPRSLQDHLVDCQFSFLKAISKKDSATKAMVDIYKSFLGTV